MAFFSRVVVVVLEKRNRVTVSRQARRSTARKNDSNAAFCQKKGGGEAAGTQVGVQDLGSIRPRDLHAAPAHGSRLTAAHLGAPSPLIVSCNELCFAKTL